MTDQYDLGNAHNRATLTQALLTLNRAEAARKQIEKEGAAINDQLDQLHAHPLLQVERESRAAFFAGSKLLRFDAPPTRDRPGRPTNFERYRHPA